MEIRKSLCDSQTIQTTTKASTQLCESGKVLVQTAPKHIIVSNVHEYVC